ncbi:MAG: NUDIX hydrolase [Deltaproteobacteria bacterium]
MQTERQISAGGVVFRRSSSGVEVALISTVSGKPWGLPKGLAEKGESLARTAHREVREETGLDGRIVEKIGHIEYFYTHKDDVGGDAVYRRYFKIVYFFLMERIGGDIGNHDAEVSECRWFPIQDAIGALKYDDEKTLLKKAVKIISEMQG